MILIIDITPQQLKWLKDSLIAATIYYGLYNKSKEMANIVEKQLMPIFDKVKLQI
jgi:hypothetical protein